MRLLFDENLSPVLVRDLADIFSSLHLRDCGLARASDAEVWDYAREHDCSVVSKDPDFHQRSLLLGAPPKVVWIRRGNCSTKDVADTLRQARPQLARFAADARAPRGARPGRGGDANRAVEVSTPEELRELDQPAGAAHARTTDLTAFLDGHAPSFPGV